MVVPCILLLVLLGASAAPPEPGDLRVDVLAIGGSWEDEVLFLAADAKYQYIVSRLNGFGKGPSGGLQETVSVAKIGRNMTTWEKIHGHFDCDQLEASHALNCSQILDSQKLVMSPITGLVTYNGDAILSGCFRSLLDEPQQPGCASIINPGKWRVLAVSENCVNMQGGLTIQGEALLLSGLFHERVDFVHIDDITGKHKKFNGGPLVSSGIGSFFIQVDPKTGHIKALGKGNGVEALYIAAGPLGGDGPIYLLARQAVNLSLTQCLQDKGERSDRNGAILTPNGFSGSGLFFDSDEEFEPTGMVLDSVYTNMVYIAGYFKGVLRLPDGYSIESTPNSTSSERSVDGFLVKINYTKPNRPAVDWVLRIGGEGDDKATAVAAKDGKVYLVGTFESQLYADGWVATYTDKKKNNLLKVELATDVVESEGKKDIFVLKMLAGDMKVQWLSTAGGRQDDYVTSVAIGENNSAHIGGSFFGKILFPGKKILNSTGKNDAFVATYTEIPRNASKDKSKADGLNVWRMASMAVLLVVLVMIISSLIIFKRFMSQGKKRASKDLETSMDSSADQLGTRVLRVVKNMESGEVG